MKVLVAGATGAIGRPLCAGLAAAGHEVVGLTRSAGGAARLEEAGVRPVVADAMDRAGLLRALEGVTADAVLHELTSLTKPPTRHRDMTQTNRLRTEGTRNLLDAARQVGARRFVTQSIVFGYGYRDHGEHVVTEDDPFGQDLQGPCAPHVAAMAENERLVFTAEGIEGISLRYGLFYGGDVARMAEELGRRRLPVTARNRPLAWVHLDDAAAATVAALERGEAGAAYNIVDDEPCSWTRMITDMAAVLGAPQPRTLPGWALRLVAPYAGVMLLDTALRVSNARAARDLAWTPAHPTHTAGLRTFTTP